MTQKPKRKRKRRTGLRITADQMDKIRQYATLQYSLHEIAVMLGMDPRKLQRHERADREYWKARLEAQAIVRLETLNRAKEGDAAAAKQLLEWSKLSDV